MIGDVQGGIDEDRVKFRADFEDFMYKNGPNKMVIREP